MATEVVYLVDRIESARAGSERQLLHLIRGLDTRRYVPTLAVLASAGWPEGGAPPCRLETLGIDRLADPRSLWRTLRYAARLRARGCRLVHAWLNDASLVAPLLRPFGIRTVVSRRDTGFWHTASVLAALRLLAPLVDRYVANSDAVRRAVCAAERVAPERVVVIRNGCPPPAPSGALPAALRSVPADAPLVGIVANLRPIKRIDVLIEAVAALRPRYPGLRAVVVGADGPGPGGGMREALAALAGRLGVADAVLFAGAVDDPSAYVQRFTVAVLCSESEGLSNALIEYLQAGRPVVCTRAGGNPESVRHEENGLLVPVGDARALAAAIARLLDDPPLAERLGAAALASARGAYGPERAVAEHMACYDELLAAGRTRRGAPGAAGVAR